MFVVSPFFCLGLLKNRFLMPNGQLQLGFESLSCSRPLRSRARQLNRAHWWFGRMRQVVEQPLDWQPSLRSRRPGAWMPDEVDPPQVQG